jgi:hypothetical protein
MKATVKRKSGRGKRLKSLREGRRDITKAIKGAPKKSNRTTKSKPKKRSSKLATAVKSFATDAAKSAAVAAGKSVAKSALEALSKQEQRGEARPGVQGTRDAPPKLSGPSGGNEGA